MAILTKVMGQLDGLITQLIGGFCFMWHIFQLLASTVLLILSFAFGLGSGAHGHCEFSRRATMLFMALLLVLFFIKTYIGIVYCKRSGGGVKSRRCHSALFLVLLLLMDLVFLYSTLRSLGHCVANVNQYEFWAEDRTVEVNPATVPTLSCFSDDLARWKLGENVMSGIEGPILTEYPQFCLGSTNVGEPSDLWVRIIDPLDGSVLRTSEKIHHRWSPNSDERFFYAIPCHFRKGRFSKYYSVKCELWATLRRSSIDKMIGVRYVITNGAF